MRDPDLSQQPQMAQSSPVRPPHGRQTKTAFGLEVNGVNGHNNDEQHHSQNSQRPAAAHLRHISYPARSESHHSNGSNMSQTNGLPEQRIVPVEATIEQSKARPVLTLMRARSDFGPQRKGSTPVDTTSDDEDNASQIRHGWDNDYSSSEYLSFLHSVKHNKSFASRRLMSLTASRIFTCILRINDTIIMVHNQKMLRNSLARTGV